MGNSTRCKNFLMSSPEQDNQYSEDQIFQNMPSGLAVIKSRFLFYTSEKLELGQSKDLKKSLVRIQINMI